MESEMTIVSKSVLAAGAGALLLSLALAPVAAQAGPKGPQNLKNAQDLPKTDHPKHVHKHKHKHDHWKALAPALIAGVAAAAMEENSCGYYKRKFYKTGNDYWMHRYYECID